MTYPKYITDLVTIDVSPWVSYTVGMFAYQSTLATAFLIGGKVGTWITKGMAKLFKHNPPYRDQIKASWNYPYYYMLKNRLVGLVKRRESPLGKYFPSCTIAYVYGKKKPAQFQTEKWLSKVRENPENSADGLNCGHWVMNEEPKFLIDLVRRRLRFVASKGK